MLGITHCDTQCSESQSIEAGRTAGRSCEVPEGAREV